MRLWTLFIHFIYGSNWKSDLIWLNSCSLLFSVLFIHWKSRVVTNLSAWIVFACHTRKKTMHSVTVFICRNDWENAVRLTIYACECDWSTVPSNHFDERNCHHHRAMTSKTLSDRIFSTQKSLIMSELVIAGKNYAL